MVVCNNLKRYENITPNQIVECKPTGSKYLETLIFTDKHLEVLGIKDEYIEYLYHEYLDYAKQLEIKIVKNISEQAELQPVKPIKKIASIKELEEEIINNLSKDDSSRTVGIMAEVRHLFKTSICCLSNKIFKKSAINF